MPLHLLSKKSWNVYAPENIARVKRDEAAAQAAEEEADRRMQEYDAEKRLAILRGEEPPAPPVIETYKPSRRRDEERGSGRDKKRKRIAGEDDTERDLRVAREDMEDRQKGSLITAGNEVKKTKTSNAPITDHTGHINLFPIDPRERIKNSKNEEVEAEKARKQREVEDQYTMRLSNAAGRDGLKERPWYASSTFAKTEKDVVEEGNGDLTAFGEGKNVWGRPDPRRKDREVGRVIAADPLLFMSKAQIQLKKAEVDRKKWAEQREREIADLKKEAERQNRKEKKERRARREEKEKIKRREGRSEDVGLEEFSLDAPMQTSSSYGHERERKQSRERSRDKEERRRRRERRSEVDELEGSSLDASMEKSSRDRDEKERRHRRDRSRDREHRHSHRGERDSSRNRPSRHQSSPYETELEPNKHIRAIHQAV